MAENLKTETAWKRRLPWIAAIVLGTLSILAVNKYLTLQQRGSEQKKVFLLAASADIKPDQELTRNDLEIRSFPAESVSEVSITVPGTGSAAASEETERKILMLVGRKTTRQIGAGQQIFWSDLASPERPTFQSRIPAHMRAFTIPVTPISSVNNLIQPGDMVDTFLPAAMKMVKMWMPLCCWLPPRTGTERTLRRQSRLPPRCRKNRRAPRFCSHGSRCWL